MSKSSLREVYHRLLPRMAFNLTYGIRSTGWMECPPLAVYWNFTPQDLVLHIQLGAF
jgi:hypothetical protein